MRIEIANSILDDSCDVQQKVRALSDIALKSRLYVSGWQLSTYLKEARDEPIGYIVGICYEENKPIAVGLLRKKSLQVFVRKSYRRRGIGTKVTNAIKKLHSGSVTCNPGTKGSVPFWESFQANSATL